MNRLNNDDSMMLATLLARKLALDLDNNDKSSIEIIAKLLSEFSKEIIILSLRAEVGVTRLILHDMDNDPYFKDILTIDAS